jgi:hypothetical protein
MNQYKLWRFEVLSGASIESDKSGQIPQKAKYRKHFVNLETAEVSSITDLDSRKFKRNKHITNFTNAYKTLFKNQDVSILTFAVNESKYDSVSKFLNMLGKKLSRKQVDKLGYVWVRDVGDIKFDRHFHVLIATSRITAEMFQELFSKKKHSHFDVEFMRNPNGLKAYLTRKELYGVKKQRSYGKSKEFKIANRNALNT